MISNENGGIPATMLVGPTNVGGGYGVPYYPAYQNGNNGLFGGDGAWIILLLLLGWGGMGMGGFGGMGGMMGLYPWMNQANITSEGFQNQLINDNITETRSGISALSNQLCNCCNDMQQTVNGAQAAITGQLYSNEIGSLNRSFAAQTAQMQSANAIQSQIAQNGCDNRLATESLRATVLSENCADRYEAANNTRDIITAMNAGIQSIKDELCADRLDAERRDNANLRQELLFARGQASQISQNQTIVDNIYNRLSTCPVNTVSVYGNQPVYRCGGPVQNGCGCGCGNGF